MSNAAASTSTPMRALKSSLALRAAPSIPPATQAYEPLVKQVLRQRLLSRIFTYSALFCWTLVTIASTFRQGGTERLGLVGSLLNPFSPRTLGITLTIWLVGVVPVLVMRKVYLTATPTLAPSPSGAFYVALARPSTIRLLAAYILSASLLALVHVVTAILFEMRAGKDPRLSVFVKSKKHPYYLNGRLIYLVWSQISLAALCVLRNIMMDRLCVRWTGLGSTRVKPEIPSFMLARVVTVIVSALVTTALGTVAQVLLFGLSRSIILPILFKIPVLSRFLRPFLAHFLRGSFSLTLPMKNLGLIFRAFMLGFMSVATWDFAESLFDSYVSDPINVSQSTADPVLTIVSGISSTDPFYKHFAFAELAQLANDDSKAGVSRREALFADQKYNPSLWSSLVREVLLTLGKDYQLFLRRGSPPQAAPPPADPPRKLDAPPPVPKVTVIRGSVLKPAPSSPLYSAFDTIASDGSITAAISSTTEAGASHIPELFRSVMPSQAAAVQEKAAAAAEAVKKGEQEIANLSALPGQWWAKVHEEISNNAPGFVLEATGSLERWWHRERPYKVVEGSLPYRKMDGLAVDALCSLVCASLTEDRYGVVQRDIPRILEAILAFLTAVEEYQNDIRTQNPPPSPEELSQMTAKEAVRRHEVSCDVMRASDILSEVADPLKDGVVRIVRTFEGKLSAFKFPVRTANKLQGFVDYN